MTKYAKFEIKDGLIRPLLDNINHWKYLPSHEFYDSVDEALESLGKYDTNVLILPVYNYVI